MKGTILTGILLMFSSILLQSQCLTFEMTENIKSTGFLGIIEGDTLNFCMDTKTFTIGDYSGIIQNLSGVSYIFCDFGIKIDRGIVQGKIGFDTKEKIYQILEYWNGMPTGHELLFKYKLITKLIPPELTSKI